MIALAIAQPVAHRTSLRGFSEILAGSLVCCFILIAPTARAEKEHEQDGKDVRAATAEEVWVKGEKHRFMTSDASTGTKMDTPLIQTPQSITVIPRAQLTQQDAHTLNEALRYVAGINTQTRGSSGNAFDQLSFRGFGNVSGISNTYLDGMRLIGASYFTPQVDSYSVERIEVLKGPASVLYGQSNPAGLINEVSKIPQARAYHEFGIEGGTFGRIQGTLDTTGPLDKAGHWLYRVTGLIRDGHGQVDHTKERRWLLQPSLSWVPDSNTKVTVQVFYQRDPYGGYYGAFPLSGTIVQNPRGKLRRSFYDGDPNYEKYDRTQYGIGLQFDHRFNSHISFHQNFRWMHVKGDYRSVYSSGVNFQTADLPGNSELKRSIIGTLGSDQVFTLDNRLLSKFDTGPVKHQILIGLDYQNAMIRQKARGNFTGNGVPALDIWNPTYGVTIPTPPVYSQTTQDYSQIGFYGQEQLQFGGLTILGGVRYDMVWQDTYNKLRPGLTSISPTKVTGRAGAIYNFQNGIAPYFSYSQSFQPMTGTNIMGNPFKPTTGEQYEAGIKWQPAGWNTIVTGSAYQIKQQNLTTPDPHNPQNTLQTGEGRSRGFELEVHSSPLPGLDLVGSYSYIDAIYTKDNSGLQGKAFYGVPKHAATGWVNYTIQHGTLAGLGGGFGLRFIGPSAGNAENTINISQTTLVDANAHYMLRSSNRWVNSTEFYANVSNLFDRTYMTSCYAEQWCWFGLQRAVYGGVRHHW